MPFERSTLSRAELSQALEKAVYRPHKDIHKGRLLIAPEAYASPGRETNLCVSPFARMDLTGSIRLGPWVMLGARSRIYTHDHVHMGRRPLLEVQEERGILWQDKEICADVWIHDSALVLYQVTRIPEGVVLGAGAVLTKNPGPYEIWAGVPARKVGEREPLSADEIDRRLSGRTQFLLAP